MNTLRPGDAMLTDWREAAARFEREIAKAAQEAVKLTGLSRRDLYQRALTLKSP